MCFRYILDTWITSWDTPSHINTLKWFQRLCGPLGAFVFAKLLFIDGHCFYWSLIPFLNLFFILPSFPWLLIIWPLFRTKRKKQHSFIFLLMPQGLQTSTIPESLGSLILFLQSWNSNTQSPVVALFGELSWSYTWIAKHRLGVPTQEALLYCTKT